MNKTLLFGLLTLAFSAQAVAQTRAVELCTPTNMYQSYACISKVEMNGVISESNPGDPLDPNAAMFEEDFRGDPARLFKLDAGQTYELKITFSNFNSGPGDSYSICAFFDWNNDLEYSADETYQVEIGAGRQGGFVNKTFNVTVPATATGTINMRVFTFYLENNSPTDPCGDVESGQFEDYMLEINTSSSVAEQQAADFSVYPVPAQNELFIGGIIASDYALYSVDGKLVRSGAVADNTINVMGMQSGMYILKLRTASGVRVVSVIIE